MDEYILKICNNGDGPCYFYKNGLLHRENGAAIVLISKDELDKLKDKELYKIEIIEEEFPPNYQVNFVFATLDPAKNLGFNRAKSNAIHYLNGEPYSSEDFEIIKSKLDLKKQIDSELSITQSNTKKIKI
jgi:hypothetical protein